jgi:hypothetical protein
MESRAEGVATPERHYTAVTRVPVKLAIPTAASENTVVVHT